VLDDVRNLIAPQAQDAGVAVRVTGDVDAWILADRRAVVQILLNLLSNAIKYGPAAGVVTLTAATTAERVSIEVADQGPGVPTEMVDRLFTPFDRLDAERWSGVQGSGLGLALSRGLAEAQGGGLSYASRRGQPGATFVLDLPRAAPNERQS
jgi:signal transduction histidine kinase